MSAQLQQENHLLDLTTSNGFRAGLAGLFKSISSEVASHGITLNIACPGYTNTERIQALNLDEDTIKKLVPAGRLGEPNELADLVCFCLLKKQLTLQVNKLQSTVEAIKEFISLIMPVLKEQE